MVDGYKVGYAQAVRDCMNEINEIVVEQIRLNTDSNGKIDSDIRIALESILDEVREWIR